MVALVLGSSERVREERFLKSCFLEWQREWMVLHGGVWFTRMQKFFNFAVVYNSSVGR